MLALGNGGSATDAMDAVADLRAAPCGWAARRAIDLTEDPSILTAIGNDVGVEAIFRRQVIAHGRDGDILLAFSTSGGSANVIQALAEARGRGLATVAMVGYDGGAIAAQRLADHVVVTRSQSIPRIQEAQASAWHVVRELIEQATGETTGRSMRTIARTRVRVRVDGVVQGVGFRPFVHRLAHEHALCGWVRNDARGVLLEVEGEADAVERFQERLSGEAPPLAAVERVRAEPLDPTGQDGFRILHSQQAGEAGEADALVPADVAPCGDCLAELLDPGDRRHRYPFINCTNCGPRFTIVRGVPYDRQRTTMRGVRAVRGLPRGVRGPGEPALPRAAERLPGVRPARCV